MMKISIHIIIAIALSYPLQGQNEFTLSFGGQASVIGTYIHDTHYPIQSGIRYQPKLNLQYKIDSTQYIDSEVSTSLFASNQFNFKGEGKWDKAIRPYRIWLRYAQAQWEIRGGLQKIDFGSAAALRPLQWFNQIDPRDPLQITNGVCGILGRYYFLNNTNIWFWALYGNKDRRGLDIFKSIDDKPEFGGRIQLEIPKGEVALTFHHRQAFEHFSSFDSFRENKYGFDAKWDIGVGLWIEASYTRILEDIGPFRNQFYSTLGTDYTFSVGNGLNVIVEHMLYSFDQKAFDLEEPGQFTAGIISYPFGLYDNLSSVVYYNWDTRDVSFFLNYQHTFSHIIGYLMAFYTPKNEGGFQQSEWINAFSGPGFRIMLVYNH